MAMSVDKSTVSRIARLARIDIGEDRLEPMAGELNGILSWIEQLNEVDTDNVEPLSSVTGHALPMREDQVTDGNIPQDVVANAPETMSGFYVVPKVVE
jgi:aspartyl-tRNA(Asn)/glutamyl-tRNA(Gln) amidotransferase subunit C